MKQRHIQSFLMVSAAFFAMSAPIRGNATSQVNASPAQQVAQMRAQIADARSTRQDASPADDDAQD